MAVPSTSPVDPDAGLLFDAAPVALLHVDARGHTRRMNAAARRMLHADAAGGPMSRWCAAPPDLDPAQVAQHELQLLAEPERWVCATSQPLVDGGWMLALQPIDAQRAAEARAARLAHWLELARDFGRLGVWERNVRTLDGFWDEQVRRYWGLPADASTPDLAAAARAIVEPDRSEAMHYFRRSMKQAGRYAMRYRVRGQDGTVRRIHSQWEVVDGVDGRPERALGLVMDDSEPFSLALTQSEAERQLKLAMDLSNLATWRHDLASNRVFHNAQGFEIMGIAPRDEGLDEAEIRARIHADDVAAVLASARAALATPAPVDVLARFRRSDGAWRHLLMRRSVQRDATGKPVAFIGMSLDVTARMDQTRREQEMNRRFELVTRSAGIGYWSLEQDAAHLECGAPLLTLLGLPEGARMSADLRALAKHVHPDDRSSVRRQFGEWVAERRAELALAFRLLRADGAVCHVMTHSRLESNGATPLRFGVLIDLTERRNAERALRSARERAALAANGAGVGAWELDMATGEAFWDAQMWILRGHNPRPQAMSEAERIACVHPEDRSRVGALLRQAMAAGTPFDHEFRVVWPDGRVRWLASRSMERRDDVTGARLRIGVNWDVTDKRTAEVVRQQHEIAIGESRAKSRFLARMSHELRTPLNAVLGFTQLLLADEADAPPAYDAAASAERRRRLDHIHSAGRHLLTLINDVLDLASLEGGELSIALQPVALGPLVAATLPLLEPLRDSQRVEVHSRSLDGAVMADPTRLRQVLLNLLSNAIKYNRPGGRVEIEALPRGDTMLLRISDTGRGMSDRQLRHLFEPFNRLGRDEAATEGTGIGLAIVRALVERMGGSVHVDSTENEGSVFELRLGAAHIAAPAAATATEAPGNPVAAPATRRRRLLYIEDNPVNALIIRELMSRRSDLALEVAVDGSSGVAQATALQPDLILLDMQLPDFDGFEVLRRLRAQPSTAAIPCIALSANAMPDDIQRALQAGMSDYWTKPLNFKQFMSSLDTLFGSAA